MQFNLLTYLGLREHHVLLDIGCGSLRAGKLFIPYLLPGNYYGIEPEQWLLNDGICYEIGQSQIALKRPVFSHDRSFTLSAFHRQFDYVIAQSIFSHASEAQIRQCLDEARQVMTPLSVFAATYLQGQSNYQGDDWVYPACIPYTADHLRHIAEDHGLRYVPISWPHPNGQTWVLLVRDDYTGDVVQHMAQIPFFQAELEASRHRLAQLESHPYIKVGKKVKRLLVNLRRRGPAMG